jgi:hypothetical protein
MLLLVRGEVAALLLLLLLSKGYQAAALALP